MGHIAHLATTVSGGAVLSSIHTAVGGFSWITTLAILTDSTTIKLLVFLCDASRINSVDFFPPSEIYCERINVV
jgi:hypothetical protein